MAAAKEETETEPSAAAVIAAAHLTPLPTPAPSSAALPDTATASLSQLSLSSSAAASASSASVSASASASALRRRAVPLPPPPPPSPSFSLSAVRYDTYGSETQLPFISSLIDVDLSEPYSVFTYRYFLNNWPHLCLLAMIVDADSGTEHCIGTIICKMSTHSSTHASSPPLHRGYIAMLAVAAAYRHHGLATRLVTSAIAAMRQHHSADVVVLETETVNTAALSLYERLRFVRDARLGRYYLNGGDAFRLKLWLTSADERRQRHKLRLQQQQQQQQPQQPDSLPASADSSADSAVDGWTAEDEGDED